MSERDLRPMLRDSFTRSREREEWATVRGYERIARSEREYQTMTCAGVLRLTEAYAMNEMFAQVAA